MYVKLNSFFIHKLTTHDMKEEENKIKLNSDHCIYLVLRGVNSLKSLAIRTHKQSMKKISDIRKRILRII